MNRLPIDQTRWQAWIDHVCAGVGVDPALVDLAELHAISGDVARRYTRPMAPVSVHLLGFALAAGIQPAAARSALVAAADAAGSADALASHEAG